MVIGVPSSSPSHWVRLHVLLAVLVSTLTAISANAGTAKLSWGDSPSSDVGGYKVYIGKASRQYSANVDVAKATSYTFDGLSGGTTYYFAVTAYNGTKTAESAFSNEVSKFFPADTLTASFTVTPTAGPTPLNTTLTPTVSGQVTGWHWDFGDGNNAADTTATVPSVTRTYSKAGSYTISLTVDGPAGSVTQSAKVDVAPVAKFTASALSGTAPASIQFTDGSQGSPTAWTWNFGDGTSATEQNPSHTYTAAGTYTVSLSVSGGGVNSATAATQKITVAPPLTATFTVTPTSGNAPLPVSLAPSVGGAVTSWSWDFGDGTRSSDATAAVPTVSHTYAKAGSYTAKLTVNGPGGSATRTAAIKVAPVAQFSASSASGTAPAAIQFSDGSSGSPDGWTWNFGDGSTSASQNPSHTYTTAGTYTVSLKVTGGGVSSVNTASQSIKVTAANAALTASLVASPDSGDAPLTTTLTPQINGSFTQWAWDFGDGNSDSGTGSTVAPVTRTYAKAGTYAAKLTVTDASGKPVSTGTMINVTPKPDFTSDVSAGGAPLQVRFTDTSAGSPDHWDWDFGDGSKSTEQNPTHSYTASGTYTVSLSVSGSGLSSASAKTATIAVDLSPGLVAAFAFDEMRGSVAADASGNGHTATIENARWLENGRFGSALLFNGSDAKLTVKDSQALHLTTAMTLEAWVKPQVVDETPRDIIFKGSQSGPSYALMASSGASGRPVSGVKIDDTDILAGGRAGLAKNAWTHLATTYDGETLRFYVNGRETSNQAQSGGLASSTGNLEIGGDSFNGNFFRGVIDEVRIYNRAMSAEEIMADRKRAVTRAHPPQTLLGSEGTGDTLATIPVGEARAYQLSAGAGGLLTHLTVALDRRSPGQGLSVGIYNDDQDQPGDLLARSKLRIIRRGKLIRIPLEATEIAAGGKYWIAILNPKLDGSATPTDGKLLLQANSANTGLISNSSSKSLPAFPARWSGSPGANPAVATGGAGYAK